MKLPFNFFDPLFFHEDLCAIINLRKVKLCKHQMVSDVKRGFGSRMLSRTELHSLIDNMPESELGILSRIVEGLVASRPEPAQLQVAAATRLPGQPLRPPAPLCPPPPAMPLSNQYNHMIQEQESPDHGNLLRKVMFMRVSDLLAWVNKP